MSSSVISPNHGNWGKHSSSVQPGNGGGPASSPQGGGPVRLATSGTNLFNPNPGAAAAKPAGDLSKAVIGLSDWKKPIKIPIADLYQTLAAAMDAPVSLRLTYHWGPPKGDEEVNIDLSIGDDGTPLVALKGQSETIALEWDQKWGIKLPGYSSKSSSADSTNGPFVTIQRTPAGNSGVTSASDNGEADPPPVSELNSVRYGQESIDTTQPSVSRGTPTRVVMEGGDVEDGETDDDKLNATSEQRSETFSPIPEAESKYAPYLPANSSAPRTTSVPIANLATALPKNGAGIQKSEDEIRAALLSGSTGADAKPKSRPVSKHPTTTLQTNKPADQKSNAEIRKALFAGATDGQGAGSSALDQHANDVGAAAALLAPLLE